MIMALLIGLLLRGGKFLTLAARRTLWQMFETNEYGPKILLDDDNLLKLTRSTNKETMMIDFGQDKDIQTSEEVICLRKGCENVMRYISVGDNHQCNKHNDGNVQKLLDELERKVQNFDVNDPVFIAKPDSINLEECISKFRIEEGEFLEPILQQQQQKPSSYLKLSNSDLKLNKSRKYFTRITEQFTTITTTHHNSLPNLNNFCSCRCLHTKILKHPLQMENEAIRQMLNEKLKLLAEKQDKRKKKKIDTNDEIKEREKLLEINQKAFRKVEDDLKTVKIIKKAEMNRPLLNIDELLFLLEDNPKLNFVKNLKIHKELSHYENTTTTTTEFIVHMKPEINYELPVVNFIPKRSMPKLNLLKLQEEIETNCGNRNECKVNNLAQFIAYEHIPRICHELNKENLENEINTKMMNFIAIDRKKNLHNNKEWEKLNVSRLQEEIKKKSLMKKIMKTINENVELEAAANIKEQQVNAEQDLQQKSVIKRNNKSIKLLVRPVVVKKLNNKKVIRIKQKLLEKQNETKSVETEESAKQIKLAIKQHFEENHEMRETETKPSVVVQQNLEEPNMQKIQNSLPEAAKSRIPIRKNNVDRNRITANKTIQKIASASQQKTVIPKCSTAEKKSRLSHKNQNHPNINEVVIKGKDLGKYNFLYTFNKFKFFFQVKQSSESELLKKLLFNRKSSELEVDDKNEIDLNKEMPPPDFEILQDIDLVDDIVADEIIPAERKHTVTL